jgi:hypothetical protein
MSCFGYDCCIENNTSKFNFYQSTEITKNKDENKDDKINVIFFYDENDERVDKNINQIVFYEEYLQGYYNINYKEKYTVSFTGKNLSTKNILVIYNKNVSNVVNIINNIHTIKGLQINNQKWIPKEIWIFN